MDSLSKYIRHFLDERVTNTPGWQDFSVIFSDANVPGEVRDALGRLPPKLPFVGRKPVSPWCIVLQGEHKIMSFIRQQRAQPGYNPNTRHILHGLDADLIMLGMGKLLSPRGPLSPSAPPDGTATGFPSALRTPRPLRLPSHAPSTYLCCPGLATHEPHFTILREEVVFDQKKEKKCFRCGQSGHDVVECTGQ
jgi:5'-3' exoribonuclease 2